MNKTRMIWVAGVIVLVVLCILCILPARGAQTSPGDIEIPEGTVTILPSDPSLSRSYCQDKPALSGTTVKGKVKKYPSGIPAGGIPVYAGAILCPVSGDPIGRISSNDMHVLTDNDGNFTIANLKHTPGGWRGSWIEQDAWLMVTGDFSSPDGAKSPWYEIVVFTTDNSTIVTKTMWSQLPDYYYSYLLWLPAVKGKELWQDINTGLEDK